MRTVIESTRVTPYVLFDQTSSTFDIRGRSNPEVAPLFYNQIYDILDSYNPESNSTFVANFSLEYFNTSSSKCILGILKRIQKIKEMGQNVEVNWYYEEYDEDSLEIGEDMNYFVDVPFNFVPFNEDELETTMY